MDRENRASYARIGFTVAIGLMAIVASLIYLGGIRGHRDVLYIEAYFNKPVSGLSVGSVVNFRGVKVGDVREVSFVGSHYEIEDQYQSYIYVLMAINYRTIDFDGSIDEVKQQIRRMVELQGLRASVNINGITGLSRIEIDVNEGDEYRNVPHIPWTPESICIPPKDSLMDSFSVAATKVMNQINAMDFNTCWSNLNATIESASHCAETMNVMLESRQADIATILDNLTATTESIRQLSTELRHNPSILIRGVDRETLTETSR